MDLAPVATAVKFTSCIAQATTRNFKSMDHSMPPSSAAQADHHHIFSHAQHQSAEDAVPTTEDSSFNIIDWHRDYQSCQRFFVNHAQHSGLVQSVAAFINIRLPFQSATVPIINIPSTQSPAATSPSGQPPYHHQHHAPVQFGFPPHHAQSSRQQPPPLSPAASNPFVSLIPFIRRLVITGFDTDGILHGFFGNDWQKGISPLQEIERRNYLFAAKSVGWAHVKSQYDIAPDQTVPFLKPLGRVQLAEIEGSEKSWSEWLAMEDWMVGPRAPSAAETMHREQQHHQSHLHHHERRQSGIDHMI